MDDQQRIDLEIEISRVSNAIYTVLLSQWPGFLVAEFNYKVRLAYLCDQGAANDAQRSIADQYASVEPYVTSVQQWAEMVIGQDSYYLQSTKNLADFYRTGAQAIATVPTVEHMRGAFVHPEQGLHARAMQAIPVLTQDAMEQQIIAAALEDWLTASLAILDDDPDEEAEEDDPLDDEDGAEEIG